MKTLDHVRDLHRRAMLAKEQVFKAQDALSRVWNAPDPPADFPSRFGGRAVRRREFFGKLERRLGRVRAELEALDRDVQNVTDTGAPLGAVPRDPEEDRELSFARRRVLELEKLIEDERDKHAVSLLRIAELERQRAADQSTLDERGFRIDALEQACRRVGLDVDVIGTDAETSEPTEPRRTNRCTSTSSCGVRCERTAAHGGKHAADSVSWFEVPATEAST